MAVEREAKVKVAEHEPVRARLAELGARRRGLVMEINSFYDTEDRRLLAAGEGLRIRRVQVLEGEGAVKKYRDVMGATDPAKADKGTIRKEFAESIERNSVHGSDSPENAATEIGLNFKADEIIG